MAGTREDWQRRLGPLYGGAVALVHSTPWRWPTEVGDEARSAIWIVLLGIPVGLVAWAVAALVHAAGVPAPVCAVLGLAALCVASAGLVERGLAAYVEKIAGPGNHAGTLTLVFSTLVRAVALLGVAPAQWPWVFVATAVIGRWAAAFLQALGDPVAVDESRRSLVHVPAPAWLTAAISGGVCVLAVFALGKVGIVAMALTAVATFGIGLATQRRHGGLDAAVVAAAAAIGELITLVIATMR